MSELSDALDQAKASELVASASAWELAKGVCDGSELDHGCVLVHNCTIPPSWYGMVRTADRRRDSAVSRRGVGSSQVQKALFSPTAVARPSDDSFDVCRLNDDRARRYLPKVVADKIAAGMVDRLAEHRYVSIVFLVQKVCVIGAHGSPIAAMFSYLLHDVCQTLPWSSTAQASSPLVLRVCR